MAPNTVSTALVDLAEAMRQESLARLTYVGSNFESEAADKIRDREYKRSVFEAALSKYVERLVRA